MPAHARLDYYRKLAKDLLKRYRAQEPAAARRFEQYHPRSHDPGTAKLADAQLVVAREARFDSWPRLKHRIEAMDASETDSLFESAADAVVSGDVETLRRILAEHPWIANAPSPREHGATLLHYSAANGVEDHRQRTPANAVEVADVLIGAGAQIHAPAKFYGGGPGSTALVALVTGGHPVAAGLMDGLVRAYARSGQPLDGLDDDGMPIAYALAFRNVSAARTLAECGARVDHVAVAAGLGRLNLVEKMVGNERPPRAEPGVLARLIHWEPDAGGAIEHAMMYAATAGESEVVRFLIDRGVDVACRPFHGRTPLHEAAWGGHGELVRLLVEAGARADIRERQFDATALGWAAHAGHREIVTYLVRNGRPDARDLAELPDE